MTTATLTLQNWKLCINLAVVKLVMKDIIVMTDSATVCVWVGKNHNVGSCINTPLHYKLTTLPVSVTEYFHMTIFFSDMYIMCMIEILNKSRNINY